MYHILLYIMCAPSTLILKTLYHITPCDSSPPRPHTSPTTHPHTQVPFVGFNVIKQAECAASHGVFVLVQVHTNMIYNIYHLLKCFSLVGWLAGWLYIHNIFVHIHLCSYTSPPPPPTGVHPGGLHRPRAGRAHAQAPRLLRRPPPHWGGRHLPGLDAGKR